MYSYPWRGRVSSSLDGYIWVPVGWFVLVTGERFDRDLYEYMWICHSSSGKWVPFTSLDDVTYLGLQPLCKRLKV